ncbi:hypothetical protein IMSHALPRED_002005 [Imshaugia aleurites]|uniref:Uncharacterized protein n=1 Tax=Imshaugia aleurites TaxID=172621 RepID=A0A8H3J4E2_9LECA|nr:hypothetical protein IMSHALPRED_002005 [Imshaugia aleurites]
MAPTKSAPSELARRTPTQEASDRSVATLGRKPSRKESHNRRRSSSGKLQKSNQSSQKTSEKVDTIPAVPAIPQSHRQDELNEKGGANKSNQQSSHLLQERGDMPSYYFQNPLSATSLQPEKFSVLRQPPTLNNKRSANDQGAIVRQKSSKRKADDHAREQEIKAMSSPIPIPKRPTSHNPGMLARDSRRIPGGLNRNLDRPISDVSLPMAESMQSALSTASDQHAFKVSAFDALSPRPTIRYSENPRSLPGSLGPSRASTRKDKQPMILEEATRSKKRVDDLADDMDAGSIRELMEREQRRLEKKRRSEHEKLQKRLQRRADKQRQRDSREGDVADRDTHQREREDDDIGLGIGEASTAPNLATTLQEPTREQAVKTPESWLKDPSREHLPIEDPFHDPVAGASTSHLEAPTPEPDDPDEAVLETAKAVRLSSASMSPPTSPVRYLQEPSNLSQFSELAPVDTPDTPEPLDPDHRRDSDTSARFSTSWRNLFRRSDTRAKRNSADRGRVAPSDFSNTSKESVHRQMPPSAFTIIPRARSGTPIRTQSRFKEDLPELPISPPDSRMQSPEVSRQSPLPDIPGSRGTDIVGATAASGQPLEDIHPAFREEVALSRHASLRGRANSPEGPPGGVVSQSLASVDSEGSWLTGRPVKRLSQPQPLRESGGSLQEHVQEVGQSDDEFAGTPEEEKYMGTLTPARDEPPKIPERRRPYMGPSARLGSDSDDDSVFHPAPAAIVQEEGTWHGAVGKHPTIVRQGPGKRAKSREGLLNDFQNAEESEESSPSGDSPVSPENPYPSIQRATSVDIGKGHARHISAGSARLLNLPPRSSADMKRLSASSGERSPLSGSSVMPSPKLGHPQESDVD